MEKPRLVVDKVAAAAPMDRDDSVGRFPTQDEFFPVDVKTFLGMPREWLQYPYHFSAFFILALLFRRSFLGSAGPLGQYKPAVFSLLGCALVSLCSEGLQFYVPTRTPALRDLALDQSGSVSAMIIVVRHFSHKVVRVWQ